MDAGGTSSTTVSKIWNITTTQLTVTWDYDEATVNNINSNLVLSWEIEGGGDFKKTTQIVIDDYYVINTDK
jgi:hypothetical protein